MSKRFKIVDAIYIAMMIIPILCGIVLQILTKPASEGITITGARIFFTIPMPIQDFPITESQINSAIVLVTLFFFCLYIKYLTANHARFTCAAGEYLNGTDPALSRIRCCCQERKRSS